MLAAIEHTDDDEITEEEVYKFVNRKISLKFSNLQIKRVFAYLD